MHSWIFRNRRRLEAIYGGAGRSSERRPEQREQSAARAPDGGSQDRSPPPLCIFELIPRARRRTAS